MSTIFWCRGCGFEDTRSLGACGTCGSVLTASSVEWLNDGDMGDETVYEISVTSLQRAGLVEALVTDGIRHRWDSVDELVVATSNEDEVDKVIDDVLHEEVEVVEDEDDTDDIDGTDTPEDGDTAAVSDEEGPEENAEEEEDLGPDEGYQAVSQLFFAADRLLKKWEEGDVGTFIADASTLVMVDAPFGLDDDIWADLQASARNTAAALQEDGEANVEPEVENLRDRLKALL